MELVLCNSISSSVDFLLSWSHLRIHEVGYEYVLGLICNEGKDPIDGSCVQRGFARLRVDETFRAFEAVVSMRAFIQ